MKNHFLFPGQLMVASEAATLSTMLGSCVGVAIWDPGKKIGGLNHYLLPRPGPGDAGSPRYGSFAIPELIEACVRAGAQRSHLVARVYGGAAVLGQLTVGRRIGEQNIEIAVSLLEEAGIKILEREVGGTHGRRINFNTATGVVTHGSVSERGPRGETSEVFDTTGFGIVEEAKNVRVLIVDDSVTVRRLFERIFTKAGLTVVGSAANAYEAREIIATESPDVMTLDIEMPRMNGVQFLEKIMKHKPMPVVMVSSFSQSGDAALESLRLGAVEFVQKGSQSDPTILTELAQTLVAKVRAAASVKAVPPRPEVVAKAARPLLNIRGLVSGVFVSGNTGAPKSVVKMLSRFTSDSPPVVLAVSTVAPFLPAFLKDLKSKTSMDLRIANENTGLSRGVAYFLPEGKHGVVVPSLGGQLRLEVVAGPPLNSQQPSGDRLLMSAAENLGSSALGILLSGFGSDGVKGLASIHAKGGHTLVETPNEASFPFVPQAAIAEGYATEVVSCEEIFATIMSHRERRAA